MFKNGKKILVGKHFLISLLFIVLIFASAGVSMDDVSASNLNQSGAGIGSELNLEDKLENSQNVMLESNNVLGVAQDSELLGKSTVVSGNTFDDIRNAIKNAKNGDTLILRDTYKAEKKYDRIVVDKKIIFTSDSGATLDGNKMSRIMFFNTSSAGSSLKNIKFINGYTDSVTAGVRIEAKNIEVTDCIFENNVALRSAALSTIGNNYTSANLKITNCQFKNNHALISAGAMSVHGDNTEVKNCTFDSNSAYGDPKGSVPYGGAIQVGLDEVISRASVFNCTFLNNHVYSNSVNAHGGAGCVRNGTVYQNCIFINNSASQGGALTYHASGLIRNCTFIDNSAKYFGGALSTGYLVYSTMDLDVVDCIFKGNNAPIGGAIQLNGMNINVDDCEFNDNNASEYGGAVCINAQTVNISDSSFKGNVANIDGGAVFVNGTNTFVESSSFISNHAIPDVNKLNDGLGGAIYINSTHALLKNGEFYYNTARNGSAIYYDKSGIDLKLVNNTLHENQAWVYALPIYAEDIYYGESEKFGSIIHGGNNIGKYGDLAVSNAIYNAAGNSCINVDGETPVLGANEQGRLYQDDREYNMDILLTVEHEDGSVVYNKTLNSNCFGEVSDTLNNLKVGKYYVTAKHFEDKYYKSIANATSFTVTAQADGKVRKSVAPEVINYDDIVIWTLNITNNGPSNATNVVVRDILPEGLIWLEDNTDGDYNPQTGTLTIDFLEVGEIYIVTIKTQVNKTGEIVNDVNVKADEHDYNLTNNHDQSKIDVASAADLAIEKTVNASVANMGNLVKWTISVTNKGPDMATGVKVSDVLPESLIWVSDDSNGRYDVNDGVWDIGTLANGANVKLNIICRVNATGVIENVVSVTGDQYDWNKSNNHAREIINVNPACDLSVVKAVSDSVVNYTDVVRWTVSVSNNGPDDATGVKIYDALPAGFVYLNSTRPYVHGIIDIGDLPVGETVNVDIYTMVNITGNFVNVASVKGNEHDYNLNNNEANASIFVKPAADLSVVKDVNVSDVNLTDLVKWTVTVTNNGPDIATGVVVRDVLPKSLVFVSSDNAKYDKNSGKWDIGTLANGASVSLNIICMVNDTGVIENFVSVSGNEFDWNKTNNDDSSIVNVSPACDLSVVKAVSDSVVNYTDVVRWTVSVSNNGPDDATGVKIYDALPAGFVYLNSTRPYVNGIIDIGDLPVGETVNVNIYTRVNVTGNFVNVASVKGNEHDYNLDNNKANASIFVKPAADLIVTKNVNESEPNYLDLVKWTITVHNRGIDTATGVNVIEVLPQSLVWVSDDSNGDYDAGTGIWNVGTVGVGESRTLAIVTRVNATGEFVNIVSVSGNEFDWNKSNNLDNESINVANATDLEIIKIVNQSVVDYHQSVKWTIVAINHGPDKATGVYVDDILPEGFKLINYTASKGFYDNGMWSVCCIESGENQTLELICEVVKTGEFTNVAIINGSEYDPNKTNNRDNVTVNVPKSSDLEIIKTVDNHYPDYGDIVEWTITLVNNGPDDSDDIQVIDSLPEGLELISYRCSAGSYFEDVWEIDHLVNGASECLVLRCLVNALDEIENIAKVIPSQHDWNESNNNDSDKISSNPVADLSIVKFANVSQANYLDLVKWTLIVTNNGFNDATGVFVSDVIPRGLEVVDVIGGRYENAIWDIGDLKSGQSRELEIICKIKATGKFSNVAFVWAQETDPDLSNNEDEDSFYVPPASDISVTKTVSKYKYNVGDLVRYAIKITNNGPDRASGIKVQEMMDDSLLLKSFHASAGDFDIINDVWSLDELDVGESEFLKISAIAKKAGIAENKVVATSDNFDPDLDNNDDNVSISVSEKDKPVNVTKEFRKHSDEYHKHYSASILQKYPSGNPVMVLVLLFVFSLGAIYGNNILKKR
ncbi:hypothetical protein [Methanobrevibacter sp.]|uniref:hypothetical protein n=1 Tax=Methanobrevibacter sp. TaxID=66852 RepID=UPI00388EF320